jgi:hypothetical protein
MDSRIHLTNNTLSAWNTSFEIISLLKQDYINELTTITLQNVNGVSDLSFFANVKNIQDFVLTNTSIVDIRDIPMSTNIRILCFAGNGVSDFSVLLKFVNENTRITYGGPPKDIKDRIFIFNKKELLDEGKINKPDIYIESYGLLENVNNVEKFKELCGTIFITNESLPEECRNDKKFISLHDIEQAKERQKEEERLQRQLEWEKTCNLYYKYNNITFEHNRMENKVNCTVFGEFDIDLLKKFKKINLMNVNDENIQDKSLYSKIDNVDHIKLENFNNYDFVGLFGFRNVFVETTNHEYDDKFTINKIMKHADNINITLVLEEECRKKDARILASKYNNKVNIQYGYCKKSILKMLSIQ